MWDSASTAEIQVMAATWVLCTAAALALAAIVLATITGAFWAALFLTSKIVPVVDEEGYPLEGGAALRHTHFRFRVWLGHVSFFPFRRDRFWWGPLRFHFIVMSLIIFGDIFVILLNEGGRPLYQSLLALFLPSLLMHAGANFSHRTTARTGVIKRRGGGIVTTHRYFTDEEIKERVAADQRQREATQRFWEL